eukprot:scaffold376727_cov24-Attheya_sp.AAC.1
MSRYKGKSSDPTSIKARYETKQNDINQCKNASSAGEYAPLSLAAGMTWPNGFGKETEMDEEHPFVYYDAGGDVQATLDYVKSGRGKAKISQKEALHEYLAVMQHAQETSNYGGMISRSLLKPNRPWMKPSALDHEEESSSSLEKGNENEFNLWHVVGLHRDFLTNNNDALEETETAGAIQALMETYQQNTDCVAGFFCDLNYHEDFLKRPG